MTARHLSGAALGLILVACGAWPGSGLQASAPGSPASAAPEPLAAAPAPPAPPAPPVRIMIPKLGVDATIETRGVGADGVSQTPEDPRNVAWYDFSERPGESGIALFAAHKDWYGIGPTVFYKLSTLVRGDPIKILSADGKVREYRVAESFDVDPASRAGDLMTGTAGSVVLYTCDGAFDTLKGEYTRRFVVKADPTTRI